MRNKCLPACVLSLIIACCDAAAADQLDASLLDCRQQADQEVRLNCYDQLADRIATGSVASKQTLAEDIAAAEEGAERRFGLAEPGANDDGAPPVVTPEARALLEAARQPDEITSRVARIESTRHGRIIIYLENGQVWAENSASRFRGEIPEGAEAIVSREGLGWFRMRFMNVDGVMAVRRIR